MKKQQEIEVDEVRSEHKSIRMRPSLVSLVEEVRKRPAHQRSFGDMVHYLIYRGLENEGVLKK